MRLVAPELDGPRLAPVADGARGQRYAELTAIIARLPIAAPLAVAIDALLRP